MQVNESLKKFVAEHAGDDVNELILNASRYKDVDIKFVAKQIAARKIIKDKLPAWYENDDLIFPSALSAEQCSSEVTAKYKQQLVNEEDTVLDMTGGLGVDTYCFSQKAKKVVYIEQNEDYCNAAINNFNKLKVSNVEIINADSSNLDHVLNSVLKSSNAQISRFSNSEIFYLDPSRRESNNKRMFALEDCKPDLTKIWNRLQQLSRKVIVKLSPMLDISRVLKQLDGITEIHVISVKNDCKELLLVSDKNKDEKKINIFCINYLSNGTAQIFGFDPEDEKCAVANFTSSVKKFLYEPNVSILKAGAYKSAAVCFNAEKLHPDSHLYTSHTLIEDFPGRIFEVSDVYPFNNQTCKELSKTLKKANITVRNFLLPVEALRKRLKIRDGGDIYLFATTLSDSEKVLIKCRKYTDLLPMKN